MSRCDFQYIIIQFIRAMTRLFVSYIFFAICFVNTRPEDGQCVPLSVDVCRDLNYNATLLPNVKMNIDRMEEAVRRVNDFQPLFNVKCYQNLKYFICNMYLPVCHVINGNPTPVYPCRHVCEAAKVGCEPLMKKYSFQWPEVLRCEYLSSIEDSNALCGSPPDIIPTTSPTTRRRDNMPVWMKNIEKFPSGIDWISKLQQKSIWTEFSKRYKIKKQDPYDFQTLCKQSPNFMYIKKNSEEHCSDKCYAYSKFLPSDRKFATAWISTWGVICFASTFLTVSTFLIDQRRFKYPERPIIFLSFCYNLYSIGYLIRAFQGFENVVCDSSSKDKYIIFEGMSVTSCTLVFFFLYFFGMASALWWVILSLTWFLSAALKWGHEAIEKYSSLFHAISWTVPTIQTIIALVTRKADADPLSGLCYVGNSNSKDLLLFVVLPLLIYLIIGTLFLAMGFVALIKIRKILRRQRNTNKLERLMLRIGVFSVLYSVPASIVVGCFIHEYNRLKTIEKDVEENFVLALEDGRMNGRLPRVELLYLRYFMLLVVGVTSGVWIWTSKTLDSWRKFYSEKIQRKTKTEEKSRLFKNSNSKRESKKKHHRMSSEVLPPVQTQQPQQTSLHGSNVNMNNQMFIPAQPPRFYYPVSQNPTNFMHAQNMKVCDANHLEQNISAFNPMMPADELNTRGYEPNNHNYINRVDDYIPTSLASKQHSVSNSDESSLIRAYRPNFHGDNNGRIQPPSSPKSISTRSYYSSDGRKA